MRNQLNGVTDGFQQLMGEVIESATSAVASLPAMVIQRANPQLYDLLTNGVLQGRLDFDKSLLSCQKMAGKMTDYALGPAWTQSAQAENYQGIAASEKDAVRADQRAAEEATEKGKRWLVANIAAVKANRPSNWYAIQRSQATTSSITVARPAPVRYPATTVRVNCVRYGANLMTPHNG